MSEATLKTIQALRAANPMAIIALKGSDEELSRKHLIYGKRIIPSNISAIIPCKVWERGGKFKTGEIVRSNNNVYRLLRIGTDTINQPILSEDMVMMDGCQWEFLWHITSDLSPFSTPTHVGMPDSEVPNALNPTIAAYVELSRDEGGYLPNDVEFDHVLIAPSDGDIPRLSYLTRVTVAREMALYAGDIVRSEDYESPIIMRDGQDLYLQTKDESLGNMLSTPDGDVAIYNVSKPLNKVDLSKMVIIPRPKNQKRYNERLELELHLG